MFYVIRAHKFKRQYNPQTCLLTRLNHCSCYFLIGLSKTGVSLNTNNEVRGAPHFRGEEGYR